jgi:dTDP-4-dehydrorhamnose reductase
MRLLLTGANGQVGRELRRALQPIGTVIASSRDGRLHDGGVGETLDLAQPETLTGVLDRLAPSIIINAAAYTAVDRAESEPALAQRVNAEAVGVLARWAAAHEALIVHYSTDYVFDGTSHQRWREDDPVAPLGVYGASKLAGEKALRASGAAYLLLRTAWVYAAHGHNFLKTMLRLGAAREHIEVVDDQHGTPTPAALIAEVTANMIDQWERRADARATLAGTYHVVARGETTWCGFARAIMRRAVAAGLLARAPRVAGIPSSAFPTPATRPAWSVLDTTQLRDTFNVTLPSWEDALDGVIAELAAS